MNPDNQAVARTQAKAVKAFNQGMKGFETGLPKPPAETPECYGWEAAEAMRKVKTSYLSNMYDDLETE